MDPPEAALCAAEATKTGPVDDLVLGQLGGPALAGAQAGRERSSGWWRMAGSPQANEAMSNQ